MQSATGKRAQITREYLDYIGRLGRGQAGKLEVTQGEGIRAVRRRLGGAAKLSGKEMVIKRSGDAVYFWVRGESEGAAPAPRRRGRPRKSR